MLNLRCESNPQWAEAAIADLETLLIDHVHCEKKAAVAAISFVNRYPERTLLVDHMIAHAQEELQHFALVMGHIKEKGWTLRRDSADPYVNRLLENARTMEPGRLLDSLIVAALIEARSCERFQLLVAVLPDGDLRDLFSGLMPSEAHHYTMFMNLAREFYPSVEVERRFAEMAEHEAEIVRSLTNEPRMHG